MGEILEFKPHPVRKAQPNGESAEATSAAILFFTGVRYERHLEGNLADDNSRDGKTPGEGANGSGSRKRRRRA